MSFFKRFPMMEYDIKDNDNYKLLPNILRRVKLKAAVADGQMIFDKYDVKEGERPEDVAYKWFGDAEYHWVILMTNNITYRYYGWPMTEVQFFEYVTDKYADIDGIHHYEVTKDSGRTTGQGPSDYSHLVEVTSDTDNAITVTNIEYERRIQDKLRQIKLLDKKHLNNFVDEFNNLISE
jgi:hypothetical protein